MKNVSNEILEESKNYSFHLSKSDNEFFDEEKNSPTQSWRIKRVTSRKKGEIFVVFHNNEVVSEIKESRFSSKEKKYLQTVDGMNFLLSVFKNGLKSIAKIKDELKSKIGD